MLFVALLSTRPSNTFQEGVARRLQWEYPEGANVLAPSTGWRQSLPGWYQWWKRRAWIRSAR
jgi:hypothetical protein